MKKTARYDGKEKSYKVKSKKKKLNKNGLILLFSVIGFILLTIALILFQKSITMNHNNIVSYNEIGKVDYKVYLKENNYYTQKYLPKGMKYVASIINVINADFNYEMHSTEALAYDYSYSIKARLVITDKNETKVLYDSTHVLLEETKKQVVGNNFAIREDVDINYDEYNDYVNAFKRDYDLTVDSKLILTMDVLVNGIYDKEKVINSSNQLEISIPMSEQTIDILMETADINKNGDINDPKGLQISNKFTFISSIVIAMLSMTCFGYGICISINKSKTKDLYAKTISKYLKEYDRIIITSKQPNVDERSFDEVIRVMDIVELIDLHDMSSKPIIYYEVIPNEKSYFIIIYERTLYKLTITRAWLERNAENEKN